MPPKAASRSHPYSRRAPRRLTEVEDRESPGPAASRSHPYSLRVPRRPTEVEDRESPGPAEVEALIDWISDSASDSDESEVSRPPDPRPPFPADLDSLMVETFDIRRDSVVVDGRPVPPSVEQLHLMDQLKYIRSRYSALQSKERKVQGDVLHLESQMSLTQAAITQSKRIANLSSHLPRFVKDIEQADSYFDFKQAARAKHRNKIESEQMGLTQITSTFSHDRDLLSILNMHNSQESTTVIRQAAFAIHSELFAQKHGHPKVVEDPVLQEPIYNLVLQVREQDAWIDREPEFVLRNIMESNSSFYGELFFSGAPVEDSTSRGAHVKAVGGAPCATSARISHSSQNGPSKELYLKKKYAELQDEVAKAQVEERELNNEMDKLLAEMDRAEKAISKLKRRATLSSAVPKFVEKIERANYYFDYKDAAKAKYKKQIEVEAMLPYQIRRMFLEDTKLTSEFKTIEETDIRRSAFAIYSELDNSNNHQLGQESKQPDKNGYVEIEDLTLQEPLYKLVFETRLQVKFMDKDPEVELEKIMDSNPTLYDACFINGRPGKGLATYEEALKKYSEFRSRYAQVARG